MFANINAAAFTVIFSEIQDLDESNWYQWSKQMNMFFVGCNVPKLITGTPPVDPEQLLEYNTANTVLTAYIYFKVAPQYRYLVEDEQTATDAWAKLKAHFEKPTKGHRMATRQAFYALKQGPYMSIPAYIQALTVARARLQAFGCDVTDTEFIDVLLMNLNESFSMPRATILAQKHEPDIEAVKAMLINGSSNAVEVKPKQANHNIPINAPVPQSCPSASGSPVDEKGYRWCDTNNGSACHRCGRRGHVAACCMRDMPQSVKDWLMMHD